MIKAIIFDLWDTLIPATLDFVHLAAIVKKSGLSLSEFTEQYERALQTKKFGSFEEFRKAFFETFSHFPSQVVEEELYEVFTNRFDKIRFFSDAEKTLAKLKAQGYKLALLSNTENIHSAEIEEKLGFRNYFDALIYSFDIGAIKPDKKPFEIALKKLRVKPNEAIMVGNSLRSDMAGANKVSIHSCWINRNKRIGDESKAKPEFEIPSLNDLFKILGEMNAKK